jgi:esterase/lipase
MLKKQAKNIVSYQNDFAFLTSYWNKDILTAFNYLRDRIQRHKQIAVVSSSCSAAFAINLADTVHVHGLVMLSPELEFIDRENYKNLNDIPTFFVDASQHNSSYKTSQELFQWSGHTLSKLQVYNNDYYGYGLLRHDKALESDISLWLANLLR